jgi:hypothetical protein
VKDINCFGDKNREGHKREAKKSSWPFSMSILFFSAEGFFVKQVKSEA